VSIAPATPMGPVNWVKAPTETGPGGWATRRAGLRTCLYNWAVTALTSV
jgi:hypothetical protein